MSKRLQQEMFADIFKVLIVLFAIVVIYLQYNYMIKFEGKQRQQYINDSIAQQNKDTVMIHGVKYIKLVSE